MKLIPAFLSVLTVAACGDSVVVFNEIHYHPDTAEASREYIELHNQMAVDVDMSRWALTGGVNYTFPVGTVIPGRGYLVVAVNPAGLLADYGVTGALGPWTGRLSNSGEDLHLRDNNGREMDQVIYGSDGKWPAGADGAGPSLTKVNPNAASDDPANWTTSWQHGGTPGTRNFPDPSAPFVKPAGLVSWWRMEEASGTTTADAAGDNTGTLAAGTTRIAGLTGSGALNFDNSAAASVNVGIGANLAVTAGISIEAIIKSTWNGTGSDVLFSRNNTNVPADLAAWYAFNESATGTAAATDAAGGPNGTFIGTATRTAGVNGSIGAIHCNNSGADGVNIGSGLAFASSLTISAWIKPAWSGNFSDYDEIFRKEDGDNRILFSFQNDGNNGGASPPVTAGPVLSLGLNNGGYKEMDMKLDGVSGRPTLAQLKDGNWHHVAASYDSATGVKAIYVDGTLRFSTTHSGNVVTGGGAAAVIGNAGPGGGEAFTGDIDDFALFRVALTASQVANLASGANTPLNVLPGSTQPARVLLALRNSGGPALSFGLNTGGTYSEMDMPLDGVAGRPSLAGLTDGQEHHVVATYDSTTGAKSLYVDGTLRHSTTLSGVVSAAGTAPATIGNLAPGGADAFTGAMDEVAYWSRALTSAEVAQHWSKTQSGLDYFAASVAGTPPPSLRLNEVGAPGSFFVELQNTGAAPLDVTSFVIRVTGLSGGSYTLPSQMLAPGTLLTVTAAQLGFNPAAGAKIFLLTPSSAQHVDSIEIEATGRGRTATGGWATTSGSTQGTANIFAFNDGVVISEIMYHPRPIPGSPAVVQNSTLVPFTGTWRYLDDGSNPGAAWKDAGFNDTGWPSGQGMFGSSTAADAYAAVVAADAPLAYWKLDGSTTSMTDSSGNSRTGTATVGVTLGTAPLVNDGALSRAITLSGSNRITVPGFEKIGPGGCAIEYWVKVVTVPSGFMNLVGDGESGGDFFMMNYLTPGLAIRPHYGFGNTPVSLESGGTLGIAKTYHIVTSWDAINPTENGVIYINGVADTTGTISRNLPAAGTTGNNTIFIGYDNRESASGSYIMDEVAVYNHPLTPARVAAHYAAGALPGPRNTTLATGPPTHYFRTTFTFTGIPAATELFLNLASDDGAVVWLNGTELRRDNVPPSERASATLSGPIPVPAAALVSGLNVLAVEVHQSGGDPDVFLGAELTARETTAPAVASAESRNTWIELYNKSGAPVVLTGWRLDAGADFHFASGTSIDSGDRLVVANDLAVFNVSHPGVTAVGPLLNNLSRSGERILLRDAADNIADSVTYYDSGRWPTAADGGGSSLEIRDLRSDNSAPESWAASDETARGTWQTYTYRATASADGGPVNFNEFVLGLLDEGEVLIDDLVVTSQPGTGSEAVIVAGGDFSSGSTEWRMRGTHRSSAIIAEPGNAGNQVLRITSTGGTDVLHNCIEITLNGNTSIVDGREYEISYRAKWQRGANLLNTRLYWNRCAKVTRLTVPPNGGTPGAVNSRNMANTGPAFANLRHAPVVPAVSQACTVSVDANDPDTVASATLFYAVNGGAFTAVSMTNSGGTWSSVIPGQSAGVVVQFYVRATDGAATTADFPAAGPDSRALIQWNDSQAILGLAHNVRLIMTASDQTLLFTNTNLMADDDLGCTIVYDESEIFYHAGVRLKGSEHGRADAGRQSYNLSFPPDHKFRGVHDSVLIDRSGNWGYAGAPFGQNEILVKHIISHAGGAASLYDDIIRVISPQAGHTGSALLQMARYGQDYLDSLYNHGSDGQLYKMEIAYHTTGTDGSVPTGLKQAQESSYSNIDLGDLGADPESYRWFFRHENNTDQDDSSAMMAVTRAFAKSGTAFDAEVDPLIDNDEWMRAMAFESLCGIADIFSRDNGHNAVFYQRPKDGKMLLLPWDWDFAFVQATTAPLWSSRQISKLIQRPHNLRRFYCHLQDIMTTTFNTAHMAYWTDHYDDFTPGQDFSSILPWITARAAYVQTQIPAPSAWAVTTAPANEAFIVADSVNFSGTAPYNYKTVRFETPACAHVEADFSSLSGWAATVPVMLGRQTISLRVYDPQGILIPAASQDYVVIGTSTALFIDTDLDGLSDSWECATGLDQIPAAKAAGDDDNDGQTNLQEYLAGTNPLDPRSVFTLGIQPITGNIVTLSFAAAAGRTYRVQTSASLTSWMTIQTLGPETTDQTLSPVISQAPGTERLFFRIASP